MLTCSVAFDRQQVITFLPVNLCRNVTLATHGIDADQQALEVQAFQQDGDRRDLIAFVVYFLLPKHQSSLGGKGAHHMDGAFATAPRAAFDGG